MEQVKMDQEEEENVSVKILAERRAASNQS